MEDALFDVEPLYRPTGRATGRVDMAPPSPQKRSRMPAETDAPICPRCRIDPVLWGIRMGRWTRYCGGVNCTSQNLKCAYCNEVKPKGEFRYVKYCSNECADANASDRDTRRSTRGIYHKCQRCGARSESPKPEPHGWRDGRCSNCWRTRIGNDRMKSLSLHRVPWETADRWAEHNWACSLCGEPVSIRVGVVDHDHACCPGSRSCGQCVRGYLHPNCNCALGFLRDDPALARRAAEYLEAAMSNDDTRNTT